MAAADEPRGANTRAGRKLATRRSRSKPRPVKAPAGDIASSGGDYGTREAKRAAGSEKVRRDTRAVYADQPVGQRKRILKHSRGTVRETVRHEHGRRQARNRELERAEAQHDVASDASFTRAARFFHDHPDVLEPEREQAKADLYLDDPEALKAAGFKPASGLDKAVALPGKLLPFAAAAAMQTGRATLEDPGSVIPKTAAGVGQSVIGIPAGIADIAQDPVGGAKRVVADYERRYGDVIKDPEKFRERIKEEGAAAEAFDALTLASGGGAVAGRTLQKTAEAGALGKTAKQVAGSRRMLRVSGGDVREQPTSRNFFRNVTGHATDEARARVQSRRASRESAPVEVREAQQHGEVTHVRRGKTKREQRKAVARRKSVMLEQMKAEQHREVHQGAARNLARLSKPEQDAFAYMMKLGLPADPAVAAARLAKHRDDISSNRDDRPELHVSKRTDELPVIARLLEQPDQAFTARVVDVVREERGRGERVAKGDPGVDAVQAQLRRYAPQAEHLGVTRGEGESNAVFLRRVKQAAAAEGLQRPGYFPSEKRPEGVFGAFAVGGRQAVAAPKEYTGALFRTGRESTSPDTFARGVAKNIKRKYNWNLVADNFDEHSFDWSRNRTIDELRDDLEKRGIDERTVAFWNPRRFRDERQQHGDSGEAPDLMVEPGNEDLHTAVGRAAVPGLSTIPADFKGTSGWSVVPREVFDEINSETRPSGAVGRSYDVAKGKASRILLGNPAWLQFQIASNAMLTGLAGTGPVDAAKAQLWWRKLTPDEKQAIEPYIGVHGWFDEQTRLGAAANNRIVNAYRAFKTTGFYKAAHRANPLDVIFKADNAQNNAFRKAVLYSQVKRDAYRRMGKDAGRAQQAQARIAGILGLGPTEQMKHLLKDPKVFEQHARHVEDFLGNYSSFTAKERRVLGRAAMFYGFLRFSLRFTFYTMPVGHPVVSGILGQLGRLHADELKRIFGADVPPWEMGSFFSPDGKAKIPLGRLNPFVNASQYVDLTQGRLKPESVVAFLPPFAQAVIDQVAGKNVAFDKPFTVDHSGSYVMQAKNLSASQRTRILLSDLLKTSPAYRAVEHSGIPGVTEPLAGKQTDTSSLFFPGEVRYSGKTADSRERAAENERDARLQRSRGFGGALREDLLPIGGQQGQPTIRKARRYSQDKVDDKAGVDHRRKRSTMFNGAGGHTGSF